jgi:hypothetical protein
MKSLEILVEKTAEAVTDLAGFSQFDISSLNKDDKEEFYSHLGRVYYQKFKSNKNAETLEICWKSLVLSKKDYENSDIFSDILENVDKLIKDDEHKKEKFKDYSTIRVISGLYSVVKELDTKYNTPDDFYKGVNKKVKKLFDDLNSVRLEAMNCFNCREIYPKNCREEELKKCIKKEGYNREPASRIIRAFSIANKELKTKLDKGLAEKDTVLLSKLASVYVHFLLGVTGKDYLKIHKSEFKKYEVKIPTKELVELCFINTNRKKIDYWELYFSVELLGHWYLNINNNDLEKYLTKEDCSKFKKNMERFHKSLDSYSHEFVTGDRPDKYGFYDITDLVFGYTPAPYQDKVKREEEELRESQKLKNRIKSTVSELSDRLFVKNKRDEEE